MLRIISSTHGQDIKQTILEHEKDFVFLTNDFFHFYDYDPLDDELYIYDYTYPYRGRLLLNRNHINWEKPVFAVGKLFLSENYLFYIIRDDPSYLEGYIYDINKKIFIDSLYLTEFLSDEEKEIVTQCYLGDINQDGYHDLIIRTDSFDSSIMLDTSTVQVFYWLDTLFKEITLTKEKQNFLITNLPVALNRKVSIPPLVSPFKTKSEFPKMSSIYANTNSKLELANEALHNFRLWLVKNHIPYSPNRFYLKKTDFGHIIKFSTHNSRDIPFLLHVLNQYKDLFFHIYKQKE